MDDCLFLLPFLKDDGFFLTESLMDVAESLWTQEDKERFFNEACGVFEREDIDEMPLIRVWSQYACGPSSLLWDVATQWVSSPGRMVTYTKLVQDKLEQAIVEQDTETLTRLRKAFLLDGMGALAFTVNTEFFDDFLKTDFSFTEYDRALEVLGNGTLSPSEKLQRGAKIITRLLEAEHKAQQWQSLYLLCEMDCFVELQPLILEKHPEAKPTDTKIFMTRARLMKPNTFSMSGVEIERIQFIRIIEGVVTKNSPKHTKKFLMGLRDYTKHMPLDVKQQCVMDFVGTLKMDPFQLMSAKKLSTFYSVFQDVLTDQHKEDVLKFQATQGNMPLFRSVVKSLRLEQLTRLLSGGFFEDETRAQVVGRIANLEKRALKEAVQSKSCSKISAGLAKKM